MSDIRQQKRPRAGRPTAEQARQRHVELLDRSLQLFQKKGFEQTTLDDIANAMHMTKRTIYGLYPNKEALFKAAVHRIVKTTLTSTEELEKLESDDLEATLCAVARMRIDMFLSPAGRRLQGMLNAESFRFPELIMTAYRDSTGPTIEFLIDLLTRHEKAGAIEVERPEAAAGIFLSMAVGSPARGMLAGSKVEVASDLDDHVHYCVRIFLNGIRKR